MYRKHELSTQRRGALTEEDGSKYNVFSNSETEALWEHESMT